MGRERKFSTEELYHATKQLLLEHGYEGFTFTLLANHINVSRAAIYKYYENKEELISEYMVFEMNAFMNELLKIDNLNTFSEQFDAIFDIIFKDMSIYQIREIGMQVPSLNPKIVDNKNKLEKLHVTMYASLQKFIELGRSEKILKEEIPSSLILGMIFQTVTIPNETGVSHSNWVNNIKELIRHGMFT